MEGGIASIVKSPVFWTKSKNIASLVVANTAAAIIIMFALTRAGHIYCTIITKRNIKGIELSLISLKRKFYASNLILSILNARTAFLDISYTSKFFVINSDDG